MPLNKGLKIIDRAAARRKIVARKQRIARTMLLAGLPMHQIRRALGVRTVDGSHHPTIEWVWNLYLRGHELWAIEDITGLSQKQIHWSIDEAKRRQRVKNEANVRT